nr:type I toxin-antitoxin system toxin Ldr family protein [Escherichia coli]
MTLAELGMAFWHDLAAPVIAGILASMIVNWLIRSLLAFLPV